MATLFNQTIFCSAVNLLPSTQSTIFQLRQENRLDPGGHSLLVNAPSLRTLNIYDAVLLPEKP